MTSRSKHLVGSRKYAQHALEWNTLIHGAGDLKVFLVLQSFAISKSEVWPSRLRIARLACIKEGRPEAERVRAVSKATASLERIGAIRKRAKYGQSTEYSIAPPPKMTADFELGLLPNDAVNKAGEER